MAASHRRSSVDSVKLSKDLRHLNENIRDELEARTASESHPVPVYLQKSAGRDYLHSYEHVRPVPEEAVPRSRAASFGKAEAVQSLRRKIQNFSLEQDAKLGPYYHFHHLHHNPWDPVQRHNDDNVRHPYENIKNGHTGSGSSTPDKHPGSRRASFSFGTDSEYKPSTNQQRTRRASFSVGSEFGAKLSPNQPASRRGSISMGTDSGLKPPTTNQQGSRRGSFSSGTDSGLKPPTTTNQPGSRRGSFSMGSESGQTGNRRRSFSMGNEVGLRHISSHHHDQHVAPASTDPSPIQDCSEDLDVSLRRLKRDLNRRKPKSVTELREKMMTTSMEKERLESVERAIVSDLLEDNQEAYYRELENCRYLRRRNSENMEPTVMEIFSGNKE